MKYKVTLNSKHVCEVEAKSREEAFDKASKEYYDRHGHFWDSYTIEPDDQEEPEDAKSTIMTTDEVIVMLREMQEEAAKCRGFIEGHVTQAWVIQKMLGKRIEKLGGTPCVIKDGKLYVN